MTDIGYGRSVFILTSNIAQTLITATAFYFCVRFCIKDNEETRKGLVHAVTLVGFVSITFGYLVSLFFKHSYLEHLEELTKEQKDTLELA